MGFQHEVRKGTKRDDKRRSSRFQGNVLEHRAWQRRIIPLPAVRVVEPVLRSHGDRAGEYFAFALSADAGAALGVEINAQVFTQFKQRVVVGGLRRFL